MRLTRLLALLSTLAALAFAAAGCSGGGGGSSASGTKPETWSANVCNALQTWEDDLKSGSRQLNSYIRSSTDLRAVKLKVLAILRNAQKSTEKMVENVKSAGAPAVKDGPAIQRDLESGFTKAGSSFQLDVRQAKKLPTNNGQAMSTGLSSLAQRVQGQLTAAGTRFSSLDSRYDTADLTKAMAAEPSCKPFISTSG